MTLAVAAILGLTAALAVSAADEAPTIQAVSAGDPLSFQEAWALLGERSDALAAASANLRGKQTLAEASRSLRVPEVTLDTRYLHFRKNLELPVGTLEPVAEVFGLPDTLRFVESEWRLRPTLTTTLPLYTGGNIPAAQAAARAAAGQAEAEWRHAEQSLMVQLVQAYFGQQLATQALAVRLEVRDGLDLHLEDARRLEREGFATRAQRLQAEVARDRAERDYQRALADLDTAGTFLAVLLRSGQMIETTTPLFVSSAAPAPLETYMESAPAHYPELARLEALDRQAGAGVQVREAALKPQVYAFGQYDLYQDDALLTDPDWVVGVGVRYTLLSGSDRRRQIGAAEAQRAEVQAGLRETRTQLRIGVTRAYNTMETARRHFLLLDSAITQGEEHLRLQTLSYREGQATSLDVIDARLGLGGTRVEQASAAYDYLLALTHLLELSGQTGRLPDDIAQADRLLTLPP